MHNTRAGKGRAILKFIIGLLIVFIIVAGLYLFVQEYDGTPSEGIVPVATPIGEPTLDPALALGYRFSFTMHDEEFEEADLENTFQHAAENVKSSLGDMARSFTGSFDGDKAKDRGEKHSSYYDAAGKAGRRAPQMQTPKRVDSQDGAVRFEEDGDGYSSATIE